MLYVTNSVLTVSHKGNKTSAISKKEKVFVCRLLIKLFKTNKKTLIGKRRTSVRGSQHFLSLNLYWSYVEIDDIFNFLHFLVFISKNNFINKNEEQIYRQSPIFSLVNIYMVLWRYSYLPVCRDNGNDFPFPVPSPFLKLSDQE